MQLFDEQDELLHSYMDEVEDDEEQQDEVVDLVYDEQVEQVERQLVQEVLVEH